MTDIKELITAESIIAYREHVIEECIAVLQALKDQPPERIAARIRALKDKQ